MQELLRLSQRRSLRSRYLEVLSSLEREWQVLELPALKLAKPLTGGPELKAHQQAILVTLNEICPTAALSYRQALLDLTDSSRASWRGTISELREGLRELLDKLAPDESVTTSSGFKLEEGARAPTMKQKVRFILKARRLSESERQPVEKAADLVEENVGAFVRTVYNRSSASVHTEPTRKDAISVLRFVELVFGELLELEF